MNNTVYLYVFDTMADWEIGYITAEKLITASGVAPLEFALHVLKALDVFTPQTLNAWYNLNKTHEPKYFYELMSSIQ